ncbi:amidase signature domain-containing protein [Thelephora terrestris]|uniref:Amidase signature domain-containing protein n=1 Tax=Thelephora terrestris TaxID=56493 RepID=A0A9P6L213_9AGAM|nr:amidase signature domain-containing protein [Thelephora terrestris]
MQIRCTRTSARTYKTLVESRNARINAFVHLPNDSSQRLPSIGGPLSGITVAVKDNICTSGMPTTCSSPMLKGALGISIFLPYDATVVKLLRSAGAQAGTELVPPTTFFDRLRGSLNKYSVHGPVINPFGESEGRSAGGSSGGTAAAGLCDAALGADTGGSIRLPASYCGVVGLKPSYGLLNRWGVVSFPDSLDYVGVLAKDIESAESVFDYLNIHDPRDPTAATQRIREKASKSVLSDFLGSGSLSGIRIGDYFPEELYPSVVNPLRTLLIDLRTHGASQRPVTCC